MTGKALETIAWAAIVGVLAFSLIRWLADHHLVLL